MAGAISAAVLLFRMGVSTVSLPAVKSRAPSRQPVLSSSVEIESRKEVTAAVREPCRWRGLAAGLALFSTACRDTGARVTTFARQTTPPNLPTPAISGPTWRGQSDQYEWNFQTTLRPSDYAEWLLSKGIGNWDWPPRRHNDRLSQLVEGDAYRLAATLEPTSLGTSVQITLTASPD